MGLLTMGYLMAKAGISDSVLIPEFGVAWNFAEQYLVNDKLAEEVSKLDNSEALELSKVLMAGTK